MFIAAILSAQLARLAYYKLSFRNALDSRAEPATLFQMSEDILKISLGSCWVLVRYYDPKEAAATWFTFQFDMCPLPLGRPARD